MVRSQLESFNVSDFVLNTSLIDNASELVENIAENADPASAGWYGIGIMLCIYVVVLYFLTRNDGEFRMDFVKGSLYSSGLALGIGIIMFTLSWIGDYRHLLWIGMIYLISLVSSWVISRRP